ncbi:MAG TPA: hypothetical protein VGB24_09235 [Longimicrobium sp.]|jgi:hypothetical protein|uniref:adenosine deaminase family protein n=1 Tax=Longimicrobium sp. TaxID=2029185 RepID=UPI002EDA7A9B
MIRRSIARVPRLCALLVNAALLFALPAAAQGGEAEERTARYFDGVRSVPRDLAIFIREMPKGADLHSHLSGAIYAESYLRWAAEDGLCVNTRLLGITSGPCTPNDTLRLASTIPDTSALYNEVVNAMSMRGWTPRSGITGHDQFFNTFRRMNTTERRVGDMLAEAANRAAIGRVRYLELMLTVDGSAARNLGSALSWTDDFGAMRDTLLARGLPAVISTSRARLTTIEARRDTVLGCGTANPQPGCDVEVRWLYQVSRAAPPGRAFAQILTGFMLAQADRRVVGLNLVQPEDDTTAMREYSRQMRMIQFLRPLYPGVKVTLHAGELVPALVPAEGLRFHIREAVRVAGASRIGHGVDIMHEDSSAELMREMARRGVMVEINLTSNDVILGIRGAEHPLHAYMAAGVPVALSTDDEGVARSEMSMEYMKAVTDQNLGYPALKMMARTSLQHAFVDGDPLWRDLSSLTPAAPCAPSAGGMQGARCRAFVRRSPRAMLQWRLERDFARFEAQVAQSTRDARAAAGVL